ncbi:Flp pilus assembly protein ATPase CpaE-like protein [Alicyclobacillus hesperidum URH17-3-68]|nr:Flp pilus assembly protein ATPase CpaE-like protein [Alicyclobacillus hesperidum URH17-3-68]
MAILTTPVRSENVPPMAGKASGTAIDKVAAQISGSEKITTDFTPFQ